MGERGQGRGKWLEDGFGGGEVAEPSLVQKSFPHERNDATAGETGMVGGAREGGGVVA